MHIRTFCQAPVTIDMVLGSAMKLSLADKQARIGNYRMCRRWCTGSGVVKHGATEGTKVLV